MVVENDFYRLGSWEKGVGGKWMVENSKAGKGKGFLPLFLGQFCANKILWE